MFKTMPFRKKNISKLFFGLKVFSKKTENPTGESSSAPVTEPSPDDVEASHHDDSSGVISIKDQWLEAVARGDVDKVKALLDTGQIEVNSLLQNDWTALHLCAWNGYDAICEELIRAGCELNPVGPGNTTPLSLACQNGHLHVVRILIQAHCDINIRSTVAVNENVTALHFAAQHGHVDIVRALLECGAHVNVTMTAHGVHGVTPLHLAAEAGHMDVMDVLIDAGCDVQSTTQCNTMTSC